MKRYCFVDMHIHSIFSNEEGVRQTPGQILNNIYNIVQDERQKENDKIINLISQLPLKEVHKNLAKYRKTPEFRVAAERNERIFVKMAKMGKAAKSKSRRICPGPLAKREASRIMTAFLRLKKRRLHYNRNFLTGKSGARKFRRTFAAENETSREDLTAVCEK